MQAKMEAKPTGPREQSEPNPAVEEYFRERARVHQARVARELRARQIALIVVHVFCWIAMIATVAVADDIGHWVWLRLTRWLNSDEDPLPLGLSNDWETAFMIVLGLVAVGTYIWISTVLFRMQNEAEERVRSESEGGE
jgi:hypothetical protein